MNNPSLNCDKKAVKSLITLLNFKPMKMNLIRSKNVLKSISLIWLVGIVSSCGVHYKLKPVNFNIKGRLLSEITQENSVIFVHSKNELIQLKGALIVDDKLEAFQVETDQAEFKFYKRIINTYNFCKGSP